MRALITGGAGFIGTHLATRLLEEGWEVIILDNLSSGKRTNLPSGAHFKWSDLSRAEAFFDLPTEPVDAIFHLASHVGQELSFEKPIVDLQANALSTTILLRWAMEKKVKKFIFASTMNVYGNPATLPVDETAALQPPSPYSVGKLASEHLCRIYNDFGIETTCLRLFNIYGPMQDMLNLKQGMASIYMAYVARNVPVFVKGSKDRFRDFVYVKDVADAFYRCLSPLASRKIYNIATGKKTFVWELIEAISEAFGHEPGKYPVKYGDSTVCDQFGVYGDASLITKELGWEPQTQLKAGIRQMADWVKTLTDSELPPIAVLGTDLSKSTSSANMR